MQSASVKNIRPLGTAAYSLIEASGAKQAALHALAGEGVGTRAGFFCHRHLCSARWRVSLLPNSGSKQQAPKARLKSASLHPHFPKQTKQRLVLRAVAFREEFPNIRQR